MNNDFHSGIRDNAAREAFGFKLTNYERALAALPRGISARMAFGPSGYVPPPEIVAALREAQIRDEAERRAQGSNAKEPPANDERERQCPHLETPTADAYLIACQDAARAGLPRPEPSPAVIVEDILLSIYSRGNDRGGVE